MRRSTNTDGSETAASGVFGHSGLRAPARDSTKVPSLCLLTAQRYLLLLGGGDVPHLFQPYDDQDRKNPETAWMARRVYGRLAEVWPKLEALQESGAAIAVTMAETDGRG